MYPYAQFKEHFHFHCYAASLNRYIAAHNIALNGCHAFKGATYIRRFKDFNNLLSMPRSKQRQELIFELTQERIIDDTRVIICFENFMKSALLNNRYLVHIPHKKFKLRDKQSNQPILLDEVIKEGDYQLTDVNEFPVTNKTITFSDLLKLRYQEEVRLPVPIFNILRELNERRNDLHFLAIKELEYSEKALGDIRQLNDFVDSAIIPWIERLNDEIVKEANKLKIQA